MVLTTLMESVGYPMRRGSQCPDPPWMKHGKIVWLNGSCTWVDDCVPCDLQLSWCEGHMIQVITVMSPKSYSMCDQERIRINGRAWERVCNSNRGPNYWTALKMQHLVMCLATMAYVYTACAVRVTVFSTDGKFRLISNFVGLHVLTLAAHSYVLLCGTIYHIGCGWLLHILHSLVIGMRLIMAASTLCSWVQSIISHKAHHSTVFLRAT